MSSHTSTRRRSYSQVLSRDKTTRQISQARAVTTCINTNSYLHRKNQVIVESDPSPILLGGSLLMEFQKIRMLPGFPDVLNCQGSNIKCWQYLNAVRDTRSWWSRRCLDRSLVARCGPR